MNRYYDDECTCDDHRQSENCYGCGSRDVSGSIGGDPYCGDCFNAERADRARRKAVREAKEAAAKKTALDKLLSSPCPIDPRCK